MNIEATSPLRAALIAANVEIELHASLLEKLAKSADMRGDYDGANGLRHSAEQSWANLALIRTELTRN